MAFCLRVARIMQVLTLGFVMLVPDPRAGDKGLGAVKRASHDPGWKLSIWLAPLVSFHAAFG